MQYYSAAIILLFFSMVRQPVLAGQQSVLVVLTTLRNDWHAGDGAVRAFYPIYRILP